MARHVSTDLFLKKSRPSSLNTSQPSSPIANANTIISDATALIFVDQQFCTHRVRAGEGSEGWHCCREANIQSCDWASQPFRGHQAFQDSGD